jgi:beta-N-acetylhexosaminidase
MKKIACCLLAFGTTMLFSMEERGIIPALSDMTLEQKIGQLMIVGVIINKKKSRTGDSYMSPDYVKNLISEHQIGGLIFLGKGDVDEQIAYTQLAQEKSSIPLLISQDLEWGLAMRFPTQTKLPHALTLGAIKDPDLIHRCALEIGRQCRLLGVHLNYGPVCDVNTNPANPVIGMRSFGQDKDCVAAAAQAYAKGLYDAGIIGCAKHFPGHGDTDTDSHHQLPLVSHDEKRLNEIELYPFKKLIEAGIPAIMVAHLAVSAYEKEPHLPASLSKSIVTDLLRKELGFQGLIITDALTMAGVTGADSEPGMVALKAAQAGNDILLCDPNIPEAINKIKEAVDKHILDEAELDEHVKRILLLKEKIMSQGGFNKISIGKELNFEPAGIYQLKAELYRNAITIAQDPNNLIPVLRTAAGSIDVIQIGKHSSTTFSEQLSMQGFASPYIRESDGDIVISPRFKARGFTYHPGTFIASLFGTTGNKDQWEKSFESFKELLDDNNKIIVVLFGNPYRLPKIDRRLSLIIAYEDDVAAQKAAADVVLGAYEARGKLPLTLSYNS